MADTTVATLKVRVDTSDLAAADAQYRAFMASMQQSSRSMTESTTATKASSDATSKLVNDIKAASGALGPTTTSTKALASAHQDLSSKTRESSGIYSSITQALTGFGGATKETTGKLVEHAAAHHEAAEGAERFRESIHILHPLVNTLGIRIGEMTALSQLAHVGLTAVAGVIGGIFVAEAEKAADNLELLKRKMTGLGEGKEFESLKKQAEESKVPLEGMIGAVESLKQSMIAVQKSSNLGIIGSGADKLIKQWFGGDPETIGKAYEAIFNEFQIGSATIDQAKKASASFFDELGKNKKLTADAFAKLPYGLQDFVAKLQNPNMTIGSFAKQLEQLPITVDRIIPALARMSERTKGELEKLPKTVDKAKAEMLASWEEMLGELGRTEIPQNLLKGLTSGLKEAQEVMKGTGTTVRTALGGLASDFKSLSENVGGTENALKLTGSALVGLKWGLPAGILVGYVSFRSELEEVAKKAGYSEGEIKGVKVAVELLGSALIGLTGNPVLGLISLLATIVSNWHEIVSATDSAIDSMKKYFNIKDENEKKSSQPSSAAATPTPAMPIGAGISIDQLQKGATTPSSTAGQVTGLQEWQEIFLKLKAFILSAPTDVKSPTGSIYGTAPAGALGGGYYGGVTPPIRMPEQHSDIQKFIGESLMTSAGASEVTPDIEKEFRAQYKAATESATDSLKDLSQSARDASQGITRTGPQSSLEAQEASPSDLAQAARDAAAQRMQQAVKPSGGRQEGALTDAALDMIPGRAAIRDFSSGNNLMGAIDVVSSATWLPEIQGLIGKVIGKVLGSIEQVIGKGAAESTTTERFYHGTQKSYDPSKVEPLYLAQNPDEASAFARNLHRPYASDTGTPQIHTFEAQSGSVKNVDDMLMERSKKGFLDMDVLTDIMKEEAAKGSLAARYLEFSHPSFAGSPTGKFPARISMRPDLDLQQVGSNLLTEEGAMGESIPFSKKPSNVSSSDSLKIGGVAAVEGGLTASKIISEELNRAQQQEKPSSDLMPVGQAQSSSLAVPTYVIGETEKTEAPTAETGTSSSAVSPVTETQKHIDTLSQSLTQASTATSSANSSLESLNPSLAQTSTALSDLNSAVMVLPQAVQNAASSIQAAAASIPSIQTSSGGGAGSAASVAQVGNQQHGGIYAIGGSGAPDSIQLSGMVSPGETIAILPPGTADVKLLSDIQTALGGQSAKMVNSGSSSSTSTSSASLSSIGTPVKAQFGAVVANDGMCAECSANAQTGSIFEAAGAVPLTTNVSPGETIAIIPASSSQSSLLSRIQAAIGKSPVRIGSKAPSGITPQGPAGIAASQTQETLNPITPDVSHSVSSGGIKTGTVYSYAAILSGQGPNSRSIPLPLPFVMPSGGGSESGAHPGVSVKFPDQCAEFNNPNSIYYQDPIIGSISGCKSSGGPASQVSRVASDALLPMPNIPGSSAPLYKEIHPHHEMMTPDQIAAAQAAAATPDLAAASDSLSAVLAASGLPAWTSDMADQYAQDAANLGLSSALSSSSIPAWTGTSADLYSQSISGGTGLTNMTPSPVPMMGEDLTPQMPPISTQSIWDTISSFLSLSSEPSMANPYEAQTPSPDTSSLNTYDNAAASLASSGVDFSFPNSQYGGIYQVANTGGYADSLSFQGNVSPGETIAIIPQNSVTNDLLSSIQSVIGGSPQTIGPNSSLASVNISPSASTAQKPGEYTGGPGAIAGTGEPVTVEPTTSGDIISGVGGVPSWLNAVPGYINTPAGPISAPGYLDTASGIVYDPGNVLQGVDMSQPMPSWLLLPPGYINVAPGTTLQPETLAAQATATSTGDITPESFKDVIGPIPYGETTQQQSLAVPAISGYTSDGQLTTAPGSYQTVFQPVKEPIGTLGYPENTPGVGGNYYSGDSSFGNIAPVTPGGVISAPGWLQTTSGLIYDPSFQLLGQNTNITVPGYVQPGTEAATTATTLAGFQNVSNEVFQRQVSLAQALAYQPLPAGEATSSKAPGLPTSQGQGQGYLPFPQLLPSPPGFGNQTFGASSSTAGTYKQIPGGGTISSTDYYQQLADLIGGNIGLLGSNPEFSTTPPGTLTPGVSTEFGPDISSTPSAPSDWTPDTSVIPWYAGSFQAGGEFQVPPNMDRVRTVMDLHANEQVSITPANGNQIGKGGNGKGSGDMHLHLYGVADPQAFAAVSRYATVKRAAGRLFGG